MTISSPRRALENTMRIDLFRAVPHNEVMAKREERPRRQESQRLAGSKTNETARTESTRITRGLARENIRAKTTSNPRKRSEPIKLSFDNKTLHCQRKSVSGRR